MEFNCCYKILSDKRLTVMCFVGKVNSDKVMEFISSLVEDKEYNPEYNSLIDLRKADLIYNVADMKLVFKFMAEKEGFAYKRNTVYVASNSSQVVPPMAMNSSNINLPMDVKVTSTLESAFEYLNLDKDSGAEIEKILKEMC